MGAALATAGYSGTPLVAKLGLKDGMHAVFLALPEQLTRLSEAVRFATVRHFATWADIEADASCDVVHAFTKQRDEIESSLSQLQAAIKRDGMIWVSWPKKASKVPTDVTEDVICAEALKLDLVDIKVAAIDEIWSGLKLVIRKDRR